MTAATFDTHAAVTALREAGFEERQAEAAVTMVRDAITGDVATKADVNHLDGKIAQLDGRITQLDGRITQLEKNVDAKIEQLEKNVSAKLQQLEDKTDAKHARLEARMYRALWMQAGAIVAAVVALVKLLP